mmetsp:Transcript_9995/g.40526  ORF Transcript_9995/g.40526 Transcript_9995/m.40526 type:complete len:449 (+) Transcript_9995:526-1872(+)
MRATKRSAAERSSSAKASSPSASPKYSTQLNWTNAATASAAMGHVRATRSGENASRSPSSRRLARSSRPIACSALAASPARRVSSKSSSESPSSASAFRWWCETTSCLDGAVTAENGVRQSALAHCGGRRGSVVVSVVDATSRREIAARRSPSASAAMRSIVAGATRDRSARAIAASRSRILSSVIALNSTYSTAARASAPRALSTTRRASDFSRMPSERMIATGRAASRETCRSVARTAAVAARALSEVDDHPWSSVDVGSSSMTRSALVLSRGVLEARVGSDGYAALRTNSCHCAVRDSYAGSRASGASVLRRATSYASSSSSRDEATKAEACASRHLTTCTPSAAATVSTAADLPMPGRPAATRTIGDDPGWFAASSLMARSSHSRMRLVVLGNTTRSASSRGAYRAHHGSPAVGPATARATASFFARFRGGILSESRGALDDHH